MYSLLPPVTPLFLGLVGDFANAVAGAIATIVFGIFGLVSEAMAGVVAEEISTPLMNSLSKTPLPTTTSGELALFQEPSGAQWKNVYNIHQAFIGIALVFGILFYIILNFINTLPYVSEHFRQKAKGAMPKMIIAVALSWPFTVFILGISDGLISLFKPNEIRFGFLVSNIIVTMAAASAGPWAIITFVFSLIPVSLMFITMAIYLARWVILMAVPMIMPIILVGKVSQLPVVSDISDTVFNLFIKAAIAPAFVMLAFKAGTMIFVEGGPGSPSGGSMQLTTLGGGGVSQLAAFGLGVLIPFIGIFGMYFVMQTQMGIGGAMAMRSLKGAAPSGSLKHQADSSIQNATGGKQNWESVAQRRNAVKAGSRVTSATKGAAQSVRNDPVGATKSGAKNVADTIGRGVNRATKGDAGKAYNIGKAGVAAAGAGGAVSGSTSRTSSSVPDGSFYDTFSKDPPEKRWDKNISTLENSSTVGSKPSREALDNLVGITENKVQSESKRPSSNADNIVGRTIEDISKATGMDPNQTEKVVNKHAQSIDAYGVSRLTSENPSSVSKSSGGLASDNPSSPNQSSGGITSEDLSDGTNGGLRSNQFSYVSSSRSETLGGGKNPVEPSGPTNAHGGDQSATGDYDSTGSLNSREVGNDYSPTVEGRVSGTDQDRTNVRGNTSSNTGSPTQTRSDDTSKPTQKASDETSSQSKGEERSVGSKRQSSSSPKIENAGSVSNSPSSPSEVPSGSSSPDQPSEVPPGQGAANMVGPTEGERNIARNEYDESSGHDEILQDTNERRQQFEEQFNNQGSEYDEKNDQ